MAQNRQRSAGAYRTHVWLGREPYLGALVEQLPVEHLEGAVGVDGHRGAVAAEAEVAVVAGSGAGPPPYGRGDPDPLDRERSARLEGARRGGDAHGPAHHMKAELMMAPLRA
jgi:hypothetical protein